MNSQKRIRFFGILFAIGAYGGAWGLAFAADLKAPMELETTQVLPKGVRNPRFKNLFMSIDSRWDGVGAEQELGSKLNKGVSWNALIFSPQNSKQDQAKLMGLLKANGINDWQNDGPGFTTGKVSTYVNAKVPVLAYGVTDRLTLALAVPVLKIEVNADTGFVTTPNNAQKFYDALCASDPIKCNRVKTQLSDATQNKLLALGYEPIPTHQTIQSVGDIKLVSKYQFTKNESNVLTLKNDLTLPTGRGPNADKALDVPTGDARYQLGVALILDHYFLDPLWLNTYGGYTALLPNKMSKRIPTLESSLSSDKEELKRNLAHQIAAGSSLNYKYARLGMSLGVGYGVQFISKTTYNDGNLEAYRYRLLEGDSPSQTLHATTLMAEFSTVEWFKQNRFVIPLQAHLTYSHALAGRNVTRNDVWMGEIVLFF